MVRTVAVQVSTHTLHELLDYLRDHGTAEDLGDTIETAIRYWLNEMQRSANMTSLHPLRGYQWKSVFLPEGTQIRMFCYSGCTYAQVVGERIFCNGVSLSPNQLANREGNGVRNAWRDLSIRLPGEKNWKKAYVLRRAAEQLEKTKIAAPIKGTPLQAAPCPAPVPPASVLDTVHWPYLERRRNSRVYDDIALD